MGFPPKNPKFQKKENKIQVDCIKSEMNVNLKFSQCAHSVALQGILTWTKAWHKVKICDNEVTFLVVKFINISYGKTLQKWSSQNSQYICMFQQRLKND